MTRWLRHYGKPIQPEHLEVGDTAVLRCQSSLPRFAKESITVPVSKGLFDEDENPDMASAFVWQAVANNSRFERDEEECRLVGG